MNPEDEFTEEDLDQSLYGPDFNQRDEWRDWDEDYYLVLAGDEYGNHPNDDY